MLIYNAPAKLALHLAKIRCSITIWNPLVVRCRDSVTVVDNFDLSHSVGYHHLLGYDFTRIMLQSLFPETKLLIGILVKKINQENPEYYFYSRVLPANWNGFFFLGKWPFTNMDLFIPLFANFSSQKS